MTFNFNELNSTRKVTFQDRKRRRSNYKLFYINIDKNGKRDRRFQANLKKMSKYFIERFEGTNVSKMKKEQYYPYFTNKAISDSLRGYKNRDEDLSFGGMGCALSHIRLWEKLRESQSDIDFFIIFEDDLIVTDNFVDKMLDTYSDIKETLDPNIDLLTFTQINRREDDKIVTSIPGVYKRDHFWGLCAYIINRKAVLKLLNNIFPLKEQIDSYISYQIQRKNLHIYSSDIDLEMDYTVALDSQIQTKCADCNDSSLLGFIDWTLPINVVIIGIILYYLWKNRIIF